MTEHHKMSLVTLTNNNFNLKSDITMLDKTFHAKDIENTLYSEWEKNSCFQPHPTPDISQKNESFTLMMPPPNVTGSLHMGHGLTYILQDVIVRYQRMQGKDVLWQPGQDHAGIATQMVVERQLAAENSSKHQLGRSAFIDRIWEWRAQSGGKISTQLRRLGVSADWSKERFTMDEGLSKAVRKVFVELYEQGLIYRDKRLVNWDPKLLTAISDLEVESKEVKGHLWYFRYPLSDDKNKFITVATTRPETMLGDTAVAVHPDDKRYKSLIGKTVTLPITGRKIPIIADSYADPKTGTGAVKITPAHDFNDFEVGKRNTLPLINILDQYGHLNENTPPEYQGLDRFAARKKVVADIDALGLLNKIEPHIHQVPYGDRSDVVIEPWLTDQWFVDAKTLAQPAIEAVKSGKTKIVPKQWEKTYFEWMNNIEPWCVSRQIWWGHQIPAWFGPDGKAFVANTEEEALVKAQKHYGKKVEITQDEDVLDTWFSSALWPFSTLGWPFTDTPNIQETLHYRYPTDILVTGFDILFFWVARMMMMGLHFMKDVPFKHVYIHALVRDEKGQKMSKSKGNVIDPIELMDSYGVDALRFTYTAMASPGRDIKMSPARVEGYRNFATKLWNVVRFCQMNACILSTDFNPHHCQNALHKAMISELTVVEGKLNKAMESFRFNEMAHDLYHFVWHSFCDWYLEAIKPLLTSDDPNEKLEAQHAVAWILDKILLLLHPVMPYITETLWKELRQPAESEFLMNQQWPQLPQSLIDKTSCQTFEWLVEIVTKIRGVRAEMNIPAGSKVPLWIVQSDKQTLTHIQNFGEIVMQLARLTEIVDKRQEKATEGTLQIVLNQATFAIPLANIIDFDKERARLEKESDKAKDEADKLKSRLENADFLKKAPKDIVEKQNARLKELYAIQEKVDLALQKLSQLKS